MTGYGLASAPAAFFVAMVLALNTHELQAAPLRGSSKEDVERVLERVDDVLSKEMDILSHELRFAGSEAGNGSVSEESGPGSGSEAEAEEIPFTMIDGDDDESEPAERVKIAHQEMEQLGNGMDKTFFCCADKEGVEYGFLATSTEVMSKELGAIQKLKESGIDMSYLMETHKTDEGDPWEMPTNLKGKGGSAPKTVPSGYWVKKASFVTDFKPKMQGLQCMPKVKKGLKSLSESARKKAQEGLEYLSANVPKICGVVGELTIMVEKDGNIVLSDVAPGAEGATCNDYVKEIQKGIQNCRAPLSPGLF